MKRVSIILLLMFSFDAFAEQGDWLVRLRGVVVNPDDSSGIISLTSAGTSTPLAGSGANVDSAAVPEIDITYMLRKHWGLELIAAITNHDVNITGPGPVLSSLGLTDGFKLFDTWVLPPTVTLQYHFMPDSRIRPYAGIGVNYTAFLWSDATRNLEAAVGPVDVDTRNDWGIAGQIGVDIDLKNNWFLNLDLKYIDINTEASLGTTLGTLRVGVDVDPFVFGAGIGYRF